MLERGRLMRRWVLHYSAPLVIAGIALGGSFGQSQTFAATAALPNGLDRNGHLLAVSPRTSAAFSFTKIQDGVQLSIGGITKNIIFYGPDTVRVNANLGANFWRAPSLVVVGHPAAVPFSLTETPTKL